MPSKVIGDELRANTAWIRWPVIPLRVGDPRPRRSCQAHRPAGGRAEAWERGEGRLWPRSGQSTSATAVGGLRSGPAARERPHSDVALRGSNCASPLAARGLFEILGIVHPIRLQIGEFHVHVELPDLNVIDFYVPREGAYESN